MDGDLPPTARAPRSSRVRRLTLGLALALAVLALVQAQHRAGKGRYALLKWRPAQEALTAGEPLYGVAREGVGTEGYPTLPLTLLVQRPFHALPDRLGAFLWALLLVACAAVVLRGALRLWAGAVGAYPPWAALALLLLSVRVLHSDVQHGNLNLLVAAPVVLGLEAWAARRFAHAGAAFGLAAVLKVTPALALVWMLGRAGLSRAGRRGLGGFALAVAAGVLLPGLVLGWTRNLELVEAWARQMLWPYVAGRELTLMQTEHLNQSLLGTLARWLTDSVAIDARPGGVPARSVNVLALGSEAFRWVHRLACLGVLAWLLGRTDRGADAGRAGPGSAGRPAGAPPSVLAPSALARSRRVLGEGALLALAMLLLSERSWKHHFVLLPLPLAFLLPEALGRRVPGEAPPAARRRRLARIGAGAALLGIGLSGEAILGARGSDLAEAWGAFTLAAGVLLACVGALLDRPAGVRAAGAPEAPAAVPGAPGGPGAPIGDATDTG